VRYSALFCQSEDEISLSEIHCGGAPVLPWLATAYWRNMSAATTGSWPLSV
jgi:hypothetical protein